MTDRKKWSPCNSALLPQRSARAHTDSDKLKVVVITTKAFLTKHLSSFLISSISDRSRSTTGGKKQLYYKIAKSSKIYGFPEGTCPSVGVGVHFSEGGFGVMMGKHGLAPYNVFDARFVDANGRIYKR
ncbi:hypothetical protein HID58_033370 [Brassica napus]|uniref:Uncharacterized protein n=1 Tax=Brassica napus TaxID=3708 RepID=A0ABQ8BZ83_BRANA|nr:hypothetical protein HID58_033370 [Brassica napus]